MIAFGASSEVAQVGKFGLVGIVNTFIDFTIYNILSSKSVGLSKVRANTISTTVAMIFSFFANRNFVFHGSSRDPFLQAIIFFAVTAFGLYILQNSIIHLVADKFTWPTRLAKWLLRVTGLKRLLKADFIVKNGAKVLATLVSLTWNYLMYKLVVFN